MGRQRRIVFLTGTRADFGKLKPLIERVERSSDLECAVFVTGMHLMEQHGRSVIEVEKQGYSEVYCFINQIVGEPMDQVLANTVSGLSRYLNERPCDLIVVHGDRVETLAGAIVGSFNNIRVAHVEGGEVSGTIDELIRHSVSKLAHVHFVANEVARKRLLQMGERDGSIHVIGSPDIDVMLSDRLPGLEAARSRYDIAFPDYAISLFHPVTTETADMASIADDYFAALVASDLNYIVVYPNNDTGSAEIINAMKRHAVGDRFRVFKSIRFEFFLTLMKHAKFIVGNSSAAVREAPVYGVPSVLVGTRQHRRSDAPSIVPAGYGRDALAAAIRKAIDLPPFAPHLEFGDGGSADRFMQCLAGGAVWSTPVQKAFVDLPAAADRDLA